MPTKLPSKSIRSPPIPDCHRRKEHIDQLSTKQGHIEQELHLLKKKEQELHKQSGILMA